MSNDAQRSEVIEVSPTKNFNWFGIGWPVVCVLAMSVWMEFRMLDIREAISMRPPIAVLAKDESVMNALSQKNAVTAEQAIKKVNEAAKQLRDAGYLVIDKNNVVGFPQEFEVKP